MPPPQGRRRLPKAELLAASNGHHITPEERAGILVWYLAHGESFPTRDAARLTGLTHRGALRLLSGLSRVLPIYQDDDGLWQVVAMQEAE